MRELSHLIYIKILMFISAFRHEVAHSTSGRDARTATRSSNAPTQAAFRTEQPNSVIKRSVILSIILLMIPIRNTLIMRWAISYTRVVCFESYHISSNHFISYIAIPV